MILSTRPGMPVVQEFCELFSQRFIAFRFVSRDNSAFEQQLLAIARQFAPCGYHRVAESKCEAIFVHTASMQIPETEFQAVALRR